MAAVLGPLSTVQYLAGNFSTQLKLTELVVSGKFIHTSGYNVCVRGRGILEGIP